MKEIKKNSSKAKRRRRRKLMRNLRYAMIITIAVAILAVAIALLIKGASNLFREPDDDANKTRLETVTPTLTPTAEPTGEPQGEPTGTPTAEPTPTDSVEPTATPTPEPTPEAVTPVLKVDGYTKESAALSVSGVPEGMEITYRYKFTDETEWKELVSTETVLGIGALTAGRQYDMEVVVYTPDQRVYVSETVRFTPEGDGFGDPFRSACAVLHVGEERKTVTYTSPEGCLGINAWMEYNEGLYASSELTERIRDIAGGTAMQITADENGQYVRSLEANRYGVHVTLADAADGEAKEGWVLGNALLVDLAMIFQNDDPYSIKYDRTNAYSSIFTCGGNAMQIDADSPEETRYDPLRAVDEAAALVSGGYNVIGGVTGEMLPNYGSKEQAPAVWDVALQLLAAQRNALNKGCCLLIYESYRPNSTSKAVYKAMKDYGYFREEIPVMVSMNGTEKTLTLANGFMEGSFTEANYIAVDSNHNKGIALDLTIRRYDTLEELGAEAVMQTKMHTLDYRGNMAYNTENADLLYSIMTEGTGLIPLRKKQEWWHFELNKNVEDFPCIKDYVFADYEL